MLSLVKKLSDHLLGKSCSLSLLSNLSVLLVISDFGFVGRNLALIVRIPGHCLC